MNYQDQLIWIAKQEPVYGISDLDHVQAAGISPQTFYFEVDGLNLLANMINPEYPGIVKKTITDYNQYALCYRGISYFSVPPDSQQITFAGIL